MKTKLAIYLLLPFFAAIIFSASSSPAQSITGIGVLQSGDTTIFQPRCGDAPCPPSVLNGYLYEWDLGDCSMGFGNEVRHLYTQSPDVVSLRAFAIYDEDEDPEKITIDLNDPKVVPLPPSSFRIRAKFSRSPVPKDSVKVAVTVDHTFAPGTFFGDLRVSEVTRHLEKPIPDTAALADCGKLGLKGVSGKGKAVQLDSLHGLAPGPTTLLFGYRVPSGLRVGEDTIRIAVRFTGTGAGIPIDTTIILAKAVKGSHDPNTKVADPPEYFLPGQYITYTIYFENIGTGPAKKVVISDFLDSLFDIGSVEVLKTEIAGKPRKFEVKIVDRQLIFRFEGKSGGAILASSSADSKKSQGLVQFRVRTRDTIGCFDHVANAAAIVFDQNPAFVTRCVVHKRFCDCQEYCNYLRYHGYPELGGADSIRPLVAGNLVKVSRTGAGHQIQQVDAQPWPPNNDAPSEQEEGQTPYQTLLIIAGALILLLLILYVRK